MNKTPLPKPKQFFTVKEQKQLARLRDRYRELFARKDKAAREMEELRAARNKAEQALRRAQRAYDHSDVALERGMARNFHAKRAFENYGLVMGNALAKQIQGKRARKL